MSSDADPRAADDDAPVAIGPQVLDELLRGRSIEAIADTRNATRARVEKILRAELQVISIRPARDYAKLQIWRLETMANKLIEKAGAGDLGAVDRLLKIFDRLDRYHGFSNQSMARHDEMEISRERLYAKIRHAAQYEAEHPSR